MSTTTHHTNRGPALVRVLWKADTKVVLNMRGYSWGKFSSEQRGSEGRLGELSDCYEVCWEGEKVGGVC